MNRLKLPRNNEIAYLEADINYTIFHLRNGTKMISSTTLKRHSEKEDLSSFLRVHKSFLLNPQFIINYEQVGKKAIIELYNGRKVNVSRRKIGLIKEFLNVNM